MNIRVNKIILILIPIFFIGISFLNLNHLYADDAVTADTDGDGISDAVETKCKYEVENPDTDDDGLLDGEEDINQNCEVDENETDPLSSDTDNDGLLDGNEKNLGLDPLSCDTDEDSLPDGLEMRIIKPRIGPDDKCHGLEPAGTNYKRPNVMDPLNPDSDGDGLLDGEEDENANGWVDPIETDPTLIDTDGDSLDDYIETTGDFDGDGAPDFDIRNIIGGTGCTPPANISDLDCDGIPNARDDDSENDGCPDKEEGGFRDQNANGIPDVFDNQISSCPTPPKPSVGGTSGGTGSGEDSKTPEEDPFSSYWANEAKYTSGNCNLSKSDNFVPVVNIIMFLFLLGIPFIIKRI